MKLHAHSHLLTDVLKGELGFGGFVVSDWMGIDQVGPDYGESVVTAINAGIDMVMVPEDYHRFIQAMTAAVADGRISRARLKDAVRRILRAKAAAGLFETATEAPPLSTVGSIEHRGLAAEAVGRSAVLLKDTTTLPLSLPSDLCGGRPGGTRHRPPVRGVDRRLARRDRTNHRRHHAARWAARHRRRRGV